MTAAWVNAARGKFASAQHADTVLAGERVDVLRPDGTLLFALRPRVVPYRLLQRAFPDLLRAATSTNRRPGAAGGAASFRSGAVGSLHGQPTAFTRARGWDRLGPLFSWLDAAFRRERPGEYTVLRALADPIPRHLRIPGTAFTTGTVNLDAQCAVHADSGNVPGAYAAMTAVEAGTFSGGVLVLPRDRVAVRLHQGDLLLIDNSEPHGNTPILGAGRLSVVAYLHTSNISNPY
jgi:hypothetical protein